MIKDYMHVLSDAQALTASAISTNVLNLGSKGDALNEELWLIIRQGTLLNSSGDGATLTIDLRGSNVSAADITSTHTHHFPGPVLGTQVLTFTEANLASAGANSEIVKMRLPLGLPRWICLYYTVSGENFTSGTIDAFLVKDPEVRF